LDIIAIDNECPKKTDTLRAYVKVLIPPLNDKPVIYTDVSPQNVAYAYPDSLFILNVYATDKAPFDLTPIQVDSEIPLQEIGMEFQHLYKGVDSAHAYIRWTPRCKDVAEGASSFKIKFNIKDRSCVLTHSDSVTVEIKLQDFPTEILDILPPNLVTLNGDGKNDYFHIPNIPRGNCKYYFKNIKVYNSWGARVFYSTDINFKWYPEDVHDGIYYYAVDLNEKLIKGWLHVVR
jgi:hypothetical protein